MKNFILILALLIISPAVFAASDSFKTYTPLTPPSRHFHHYRHNNKIYPNKKYLGHTPQNRRFKNRNSINHNYYNYNSPYYNYYPQGQSLFSSIKSFFSPGKMTGYTPSNTYSFDNIPYGYQTNITTPDGDDYLDNYGFKSGATVKILD